MNYYNEQPRPVFYPGGAIDELCNTPSCLNVGALQKLVISS